MKLKIRRLRALLDQVECVNVVRTPTQSRDPACSVRFPLPHPFRSVASVLSVVVNSGSLVLLVVSSGSLR